MFKGMVIDDDREITSLINTDHNFVISLLHTNYKKVEWQRAKRKPKWDTKSIDKECSLSTLKAKLLQDEKGR